MPKLPSQAACEQEGPLRVTQAALSPALEWATRWPVESDAIIGATQVPHQPKARSWDCLFLGPAQARGQPWTGKPIADPFATQVLAKLPVRNLVIGITPFRHFSLSLPPADSGAPLPTANQPACEHKAASEESQHAR